MNTSTRLPRAQYNALKPVITVHESMPIGEAIKVMNERKISCLLLSNDDERVVGIFTERDVLRRLTLLDLSDKLERAVGTIATREVLFANLDDLHASVVRLHFEKNVRHFPVLSGKDPVLSNLVGIVTVTDVIRYFLNFETAHHAAKAAEAASTPLAPRPLSVICQNPKQMQLYHSSFGNEGFAPQRVEDTARFFREQENGRVPLIFDFDNYQKNELSSLIVLAKKYRGHLIMTASDLNIVNLFRRYLDKDRQTIALKPFDTDYLVWLLTTKWEGSEPAK